VCVCVSQRADASSLAAEADGPEDDDDLDLAAARSLLQSEDQLLQAVHSTRSVAALVKTSKDKLSQGQGQAQAQGPAISNVINEVGRNKWGCIEKIREWICHQIICLLATSPH
jgi:hypothetical protein